MKNRRPPGPDAGRMGLAHFQPFRADPLGFLARLVAEHGDFVRFELGTTPYYVVNRPDLVRQLFVEYVERLRKPAYVSDSNRGHWGDGLTTLEGEDWRSRRALLRPVFRGDAFPRQEAIVAECTQDMLSSWRHGQAVDLGRQLRILTARIAARVLFDAEVEGFGSPEANLRRAGLIRFEEAFGEDFISAMRDESVAPLTMTRPRAPRNMDSTLALIDERLRTREDRGDVLSLLVGATRADGTRPGREELAGELIQMLFAGHLTVPAALTRFWRALARNPKAERRVYEEAEGLPPAGAPDAGAGSPGFCEQALKETLRLSPPAPILFREVAASFELEGFALEPRAAVWVCPWLLHHDARYFPEPERFLPERFAPENAGRIPEFSYLPFGAGPRTCAGRRQALGQMVLIASMTARRYALHPKREAPGGDWFEVDGRR